MRDERLDDHVVPVTAFNGVIDEDGPDPFAGREAEIAAHWREALAERPAMYDGRVLVAVRSSVEDGTLSAAYRDVAFSAFNWWRATQPLSAVRNVFGCAAVMSSDGAVLLGRMAPHTAPAGKIYFPCGTPDRDDVFDGRVDLDHSLERELGEETGLAGEVAQPSETRFAVFAPKVLAYVRRYDSPLHADALKAHVEAHLASEARPELDAIVMARSLADVTDASPPYVARVLTRLLAR